MSAFIAYPGKNENSHSPPLRFLVTWFLGPSYKNQSIGLYPWNFTRRPLRIDRTVSKVAYMDEGAAYIWFICSYWRLRLSVARLAINYPSHNMSHPWHNFSGFWMAWFKCGEWSELWEGLRSVIGEYSQVLADVLVMTAVVFLLIKWMQTVMEICGLIKLKLMIPFANCEVYGLSTRTQRREIMF